MGFCFVLNCSTNRLSNKEQTDNGISFHRFRSNEYGNRWKRICQRSDRVITKTCRICSVHFKQDQFDPFDGALKRNAMPTESFPVVNLSSAPRSFAEDSLASAPRSFAEDCLASAPRSFAEDSLASPPRSFAEDSLASAPRSFEEDSLASTSRSFEEDSLASAPRSLERDNLWTCEDIAKAMSIYESGPHAYEKLLKENNTLPDIITLKKWASKIKIEEGFIDVVFKMLSECDWDIQKKVCILMFDETTAITKKFEYDSENDILYGPSSSVIVLMIRGMFEDYEHPIYFKHDTAINKVLLNDAFKNLDDIGFVVVGVVADMHPEHLSLWNEFLIDEEHPYVLYENRKIYVFTDGPHLINRFNENFFESGIILENKYLNNSTLLDLVEKQELLGIVISKQLNKVYFKSAIWRNFDMPTHIFSRENIKALMRLSTLDSCSQNCREVAQLFEIVRNWYEVFSSCNPTSDGDPKLTASYGIYPTEQNSALDAMTYLAKTMRVGVHANLIPFQKGIINNNKALKMLWEDLGRKPLLTDRLNQNPIEKFFDEIIAQGNTTVLYNTRLQFNERLRSYLLQRNQEIICQYDFQGSNSSEQLDAPQQCQFNNEPQSDAFPDLVNIGLERIGKKIIDVLINKIQTTITEYVSNTNTPNELFIQELRKLNKIFNEYNNIQIQIGPNIRKNLLLRSDNILIHLEIKKMFFNERISDGIFFLNSEENQKSPLFEHFKRTFK